MKVIKLYDKSSTGKKSQSASLYDPDGLSPTITAGTHGYSLGQILERESMRIRKLTPTECEKLMGWPIGHTKYGNYNGIIKELSDTQRYKICGNGIVSDVSQSIVHEFLPEGEYRVMSTFSGADGSCLKLGERFKTVGFFEFDPKSKIQHPSAVLKYHHPKIPNFGDITKHGQHTLPEFDVMFTSPPCQTFSIAGGRKGFGDPRGTLFQYVVEMLVAHPECKYLVFENVPGMLSHDNGNTFLTILNEFSKIGFELDFNLYNAKDFGIPQNRSRIFLLGKRK